MTSACRDSRLSDPIPRRQVEFTFDPHCVPRDWFHRDPFLSTFMNALSLLFPEGERFFVDSVKHYRPEIASPELKERVVGFIGQEAMHGKGHRLFNDMFRAHGLSQAPRLEAQLRRRLLDVGRRVFPPRVQLATTCALEHFTAILAEMLLRNETLQGDLDASVRSLWLWHALEETEHKAVAYDVYQAVGGGYFERALTMALITAIFFAELAHVHLRFMAARGILWKPWRWLRGLSRMWLWPGYFLRLIPAYLAYFRPGFHPNDRDASELVSVWRERLFGEAGDLRASLRGRLEVA